MIKGRRDSRGAAFVVPSTPKAPRSARKKCIKKSLEDDDQLCAFDLLAAVAGKLLQENDNSSASSNETETKGQFVCHKNETHILDEQLSELSTSEGSQNVEADLSIGISVRADVPPYNDSPGFEMKQKQKVETRGQSTADLSNSNSAPNRDDSEVYINCCTKGSNIRAYRSLSHSGSSRVRQLLRNKYWKASPKLRDHDSCSDAGAKHVNRSRKTHKEPEGVETSPVKKRKLFDQSSVVTSDRGFYDESFSKSDIVECAVMNKSSNGANEECSSTKHHSVSVHARDSQVRFIIKSFNVPELLVEVPLTETVGSLKMTVLEAVTSVLSRDLHVEVMVGGKRITDDTDMLICSGISRKCNLDSLSFMLEPSSSNSPSPISHNDHLVLSSGNDHKPSERSPSIALADSEISDDPSPLPILRKEVKIDHVIVPDSTNKVPEKSEESKALALFPVTTSAEPLAIATMKQKSKHSELGQRRTRRPFSVSEVEALVQSVEGLGTGRWRDVKMRSFENVEHRTYVDLKDKWKTLVHTAQISPQQRRGQPVPQELLNRVLAAHAYWSQHHQIKPHTRTHFLPAPRDQ